MDNQQVSGDKVKSYWTQEKVADVLREKAKELSHIPRANEVSGGFRSVAYRHFGSWNKALKYTFGSVTQARYGELTDQELLSIVREFVVKNQRLPQRQEFDGKSYPYFEAYTIRFKLRTWAEILGLVDLNGLTYYANKHGYGKIFKYNGVTYLSREEYLIGKYLTEQGIRFEKEVPYGNSNHIFDFYLPDDNMYIEYYGISTPEYRQRIKEKQAKYCGRNVIEIYKHDNTLKTLSLKLHRP